MNPDVGFEQDLTVCAHLLAQERTPAVLLLPTETVYGLVCDYANLPSRERIFELKARPKEKLLTAFLASADVLPAGIPSLPFPAKVLAQKFCPGPLTLIVPDGQGGTFGFRIPDHPFLLELLRRHGRPLASTSANRSGEPAAKSVPEALSSLTEPPDYVVDGGILPDENLASTIVLVEADGTWKILRQGPIREETIRAALEATTAPPSPVLGRHTRVRPE